MRKPRWQSNAWVLIALGVIGLLAGADALRGALPGSSRRHPPTAPAAAGREAALRRQAAEMSASLRLVGQPAPDFQLPDGRGHLHHLSEFRGRRFVLAFFSGSEPSAAMARGLAWIYGMSRARVPTVAVMSPEGNTSIASAFERSTRGHFLYLRATGSSGVVEQYHAAPFPKVFIVDGAMKIERQFPISPADSPTSALPEIALALRLRPKVSP